MNVNVKFDEYKYKHLNHYRDRVQDPMKLNNKHWIYVHKDMTI